MIKKIKHMTKNAIGRVYRIAFVCPKTGIKFETEEQAPDRFRAIFYAYNSMNDFTEHHGVVRVRMVGFVFNGRSGHNVVRVGGRQ